MTREEASAIALTHAEEMIGYELNVVEVFKDQGIWVVHLEFKYGGAKSDPPNVIGVFVDPNTKRASLEH
jgi:hypothetical protein